MKVAAAATDFYIKQLEVIKEQDQSGSINQKRLLGELGTLPCSAHHLSETETQNRSYQVQLHDSESRIRTLRARNDDLRRQLEVSVH